MKRAFIRPVYYGDEVGGLLSLAVTAVKGRPLTDADILEHFPADTPGVDIKAMAVEMGWASDAASVDWGKPLYI